MLLLTIFLVILETEEFVPPPLEEMEILFELAISGDMRGLQERAASLETQNETFRPFAHKLYQLAKNFQDRQVLTLIEKYKE